MPRRRAYALLQVNGILFTLLKLIIYSLDCEVQVSVTTRPGVDEAIDNAGVGGDGFCRCDKAWRVLG